MKKILHESNLAGSKYVVGTTHDKPEGTVTTTDGTATAIVTIPTTNGYTYLVEANVIGTDTATGDSVAYKVFGLYQYMSGTLTEAATEYTTVQVEDSTISASTTIGSEASGTNIVIKVTGKSSTNITWSAFYDVYVHDV